MSTFDARSLARGWLSVAVASGKDSGRPALDRTMSIEAYPTGLRLVATDSYVLLRSWVPNIEHDLEPEPSLDEAPYATAVAMDPHGRGRGFLGHVLRLAAQENALPVEVRVSLGVVDEIDETDQGAFAGMEARYVVLDLPDQERLKLQSYDGSYPSWRGLQFKGETTARVGLNPAIIGRLAKLGKVHKEAMLGWEFGGEVGAARLVVVGADPTCEGLVMPCRWDFDRNAPRVDDEDESADEEAADA